MNNIKIYIHVVVFILLVTYSGFVCCWGIDIKPNSFSILQHNDSRIQKFSPHSDDNAHDVFKILRIERDHVIIGAKNNAYTISLNTLEEVKYRRVSWSPEESNKDSCSKKESLETCENFIRLLVPVNSETAYVCGTYAYSRKCAIYNFIDDTPKNIKYEHVIDNNPYIDSTITYSHGYVYSNIVFRNRRYPNIVRFNHKTSEYVHTTGMKDDKAVVHNPRFVKSFNYGDNIYFFFSELDYKNINTLSRVARVCKSDSVGKKPMHGGYVIFTSYFKSRLTCYRRGVLPFHFDEIAAVSDVGESNFKYNNLDKRDAVYAVFNTPTHAVSASAVCLYQMLDIARSFEGNFKKNTSDECDVSEIRAPNGTHPHKCTKNSFDIKSNMLKFIRRHTIMSRTVHSSGDNPAFVVACVKYRFSSVAVDWRLLASDENYYDIIFVGTNDGRVLKIANNGANISVGENNIIEELRVFRDNRTITGLHLHRQANSDAKLIIESYNQILSVPPQRCHERVTCSDCVALKDPYCSWIDTYGCVVTKTGEKPWGLQNIQTGIHILCIDDTYSSSRSAEGRTTVFTQGTTPVPKCTDKQIVVVSNLLSILLTGIIALAVGYQLGKLRRTKEDKTDAHASGEEDIDTIIPLKRVSSSQTIPPATDASSQLRFNDSRRDSQLSRQPSSQSTSQAADIMTNIPLKRTISSRRSSQSISSVKDISTDVLLKCTNSSQLSSPLVTNSPATQEDPDTGTFHNIFRRAIYNYQNQ